MKYLIKDRYLQGIRGAKIVFIGIPSIYIILNLIILFFGYNKIIFENVRNIDYGEQIPFFGFLFFVVVIAFASLYPWRKKWKFFVEIGIENIVEEYKFLLKFRKYSILLLVMLILVYFLTGGEFINKLYSLVYFDYRGLSLFQNIIRVFIMPLYIITYAAILKNISFNQHRFFLTKGCAILFAEKRDTINKIIYLMMCLSFYNKYLQKKINLRIHGIEKISSSIAASISPQKNIIQDDNNNLYDINNRSLDSISLDLVKEFDKDNDKLAPLRFLTNFLEKEKTIENIFGKRKNISKDSRKSHCYPKYTCISYNTSCNNKYCRQISG